MLVRWEFWPRVAASTPLPPSRCLVSCCLHQPKRSFQRCGTVCMAQPVPDTSQGQTSTGHLSQSRQMQRCSSPPTHTRCAPHTNCAHPAVVTGPPTTHSLLTSDIRWQRCCVCQLPADTHPLYIIPCSSQNYSLYLSSAMLLLDPNLDPIRGIQHAAPCLH